MTLDFLLRADPLHRAHAPVERADSILTELGLSRHSANRFAGSTCEAFVSNVAPNQPGSDVIRGDGLTFNELAVHVRGHLTPATFEVLFRAANALSWEIHDPQSGERLRDALAPIAEPPPLSTVGTTRCASDAWDGRAIGLASLGDDVIAVAAAGKFIGERFDVEVRRGRSLARALVIEGACPPIAASRADADGARWLACGAHGEHHRAHATRVARVSQGEVTDASHVLPLAAPVAWLPDRSGTFVTVLAIENERAHRGAIADALRALGRQPRLAVVDLQNRRVHPLANDEVLGLDSLLGVAIAATADVAFALADGALVAASLRTGRLLYRGRDEGCSGLVASPCGGFVATFGAIGARTEPHALRVRQAQTGRTVLAASLDALGASSTHVASAAFHPEGWIALGLANGDVRRVVLGTGEVTTLAEVEGGVHCLLFSDRFDRLCVGARTGITELALGRPIDLPSLPAATPISWRFDDDAPRLAMDDATLLRQASFERFASVPDLEDRVSVLLRHVAPERRTHVGQLLLRALAARAVERGTEMDARFHPLVSELSPYASDLDEWRAIMKTIAPSDQARLLFARRDLPGNTRFVLVPPTIAAPVFAEVIASMPRGAFSKLNPDKRADFRVAHGGTAAEMEARLLSTAKVLGAPLIAPLERAMASASAGRALLTRALDAARGAVPAPKKKAVRKPREVSPEAVAERELALGRERLAAHDFAGALVHLDRVLDIDFRRWPMRVVQFSAVLARGDALAGLGRDAEALACWASIYNPSSYRSIAPAANAMLVDSFVRRATLEKKAARKRELLKRAITLFGSDRQPLVAAAVASARKALAGPG